MKNSNFKAFTVGELMKRIETSERDFAIKSLNDIFNCFDKCMLVEKQFFQKKFMNDKVFFMNNNL